MKLVTPALVSLLLLAGCSAPAASAAPITPAVTTPTTAQAGPASMLKMPLGTVATLGPVTATVLSSGVRDAAHTAWTYRVRVCMAEDGYATRVGLSKWQAAKPGGDLVPAAAIPGVTTDAYVPVKSGQNVYGASSPITPGRCVEGRIFFQVEVEPDRVWYWSDSSGMVGWDVKA